MTDGQLTTKSQNKRKIGNAGIIPIRKLTMLA